MKKLVISILSVLMILTQFVPTFASEQSVYREKVSDNLYFESVIEEISTSRATYKKTGKKTTTAYDGNNTALWSVTVTGTFEYDGSHSICTAASVSTTCPASTWKIVDSYATKSGASATAVATAKHYQNGEIIDSQNKAVSLACGVNGDLY